MFEARGVGFTAGATPNFVAIILGIVVLVVLVVLLFVFLVFIIILGLWIRRTVFGGK